MTDQLGFVATAVGDHPDIEPILLEANKLGFRTSVSSIRIPAVTEGVLWALHASGDRSITLAPETGTDELRRKLNKPITNAVLLEKVRLIFRQGFTQLKLYFLIGLPEETLERRRRASSSWPPPAAPIMLEELAPARRHRPRHLGVNILVPKPYTPWQREPLAPTSASCARRSRSSSAAWRGCPTSRSAANMSMRQAVWQTYISQGRRRGRRRRSSAWRAAPRSRRSCASSPTASTPRSTAASRATCAGISSE